MTVQILKHGSSAISRLPLGNFFRYIGYSSHTDLA
jgi:hypothetical protein